MLMKVCGMNYQNNISQLEKVDIDFMGLIFYAKSPRFVRHNLRFTNYGIKKIGVFVNAESSFIQNKIEKYGLAGIQLHGLETPEDCERLREKGLLVLKAFAIDAAFDFNVIEKYNKVCDYFLFDTKGDLHGGTGETFPWQLLKNYDGQLPFILSGGIGLKQISDLRKFSHRKWKGIDINSQFETRPGYKNIRKVKKFRHEFFSGR